MPPAEVKHLEGEDAPAHPDSPPQGTSAPCNLGPRKSRPPRPGPPLPDAPIPRRYLAGGRAAGAPAGRMLAEAELRLESSPSSGANSRGLRPAAEPPGKWGEQPRRRGGDARSRRSRASVSQLGLRRSLRLTAAPAPPRPAPPRGPARKPRPRVRRAPRSPSAPRPASPPASRSPPSSLSLRLAQPAPPLAACPLSSRRAPVPPLLVRE